MSKTYSIGELARKAGVSVRTIRFYIDEGLIPPPQVRGRNTLYGEEYLDRIALILRLKEAYLPLREIQQRMDGLSIEAVRELLGQQVAEGVKRDASRMPNQSLKESDIQPLSEENTPAMDYIARILEAHTPASSPAEAQFRRSAQSPSPATPPRPRGFPQPTPQFQATWQRILLAPGIELHVSQQTMAEKQAVIQRLVELARQLFENKVV